MDLEVNLKKFVSGDEKAFTKVYTLMRQDIFAYLASRINIREDALDLTSEVFIKVYRNRQGFKAESSLKTWIYRIAQNTLIDYLRQKKKTQELFLEMDEEKFSEFPDMIEEEDLDAKKVLENTNSQELTEILDKLHPRYKNLLIMKYLNNLSTEEICDVLNITENNYFVLLNRALKSAQKLIKSY